jgi:hypothetical protein
MFDSKTTISAAPVIKNNPGSKYVMVGETLINEDKANGNKRLFWAEFEIVALPPEHGSLTGDIDSNDPETIFIDPDLHDISTLNGKCTLVFEWGKHDIAILAISSSKTVVCRGYTLNISVTLENQGNYTESFSFTIYANAMAIKTEGVILPEGDDLTVNVVWNTTNVNKGNFSLSAIADIVHAETDIADNYLSDGWVIVAMVGDITGPNGFPDGKCNIRDLGYAARQFGKYVPPAPANCDITNDGKIDMKDLTIMARHFGEVDL